MYAYLHTMMTHLVRRTTQDVESSLEGETRGQSTGGLSVFVPKCLIAWLLEGHREPEKRMPGWTHSITSRQEPYLSPRLRRLSRHLSPSKTMGASALSDRCEPLPLPRSSCALLTEHKGVAPVAAVSMVA